MPSPSVSTAIKLMLTEVLTASPDSFSTSAEIVSEPIVFELTVKLPPLPVTPVVVFSQLVVAEISLPSLSLAKAFRVTLEPTPTLRLLAETVILVCAIQPSLICAAPLIPAADKMLLTS